MDAPQSKRNMNSRVHMASASALPHTHRLTEKIAVRQTNVCGMPRNKKPTIALHITSPSSKSGSSAPPCLLSIPHKTPLSATRPLTSPTSPYAKAPCPFPSSTFAFPIILHVHTEAAETERDVCVYFHHRSSGPVMKRHMNLDEDTQRA